jgi:4-amino-4-deoxy-L-arabinose transferase-like glycosyltransferase
MSAMTGARRGQSFMARLMGRLVEPLLDGLTDPARRERTAVAALVAYVGLWTLYGVLAKGSQDIHSDMSEQFALSREMAWGYPKHPPLGMAVVRIWFTVFPAADWSYYLLAMVTAGLALWIAWRLSARFLDGDKRVVGLALLTLVPFFNFHALKFNQNTVLLPLWAATTLWFLRSFETRRLVDAALAGLGAAACMYGKYWSIVLLLGLGFAALADSRRATYFRSAAPWVTVMVGALALAPHVAWLVANDFAPFSYAVDVHGAASVATTVRGSLSYLAGSVAYVAVPLLLVVLVARPSRAAVEDMGWPASAERRLAATAFWATLLLPALAAPFIGVQLVSLWSISAFTLLPMMLLSSPLVAVNRRDALRIVALAVALPFVMVAVAPAIAFAVHRSGPAPDAAHSSLLAAPIEQLWRDTTDRPLRLFAGYDDFTDGLAFYLPSHPLAPHLLQGQLSPAMEERIGRDGIALLCPVRPRLPVTAAWCLDTARSLAARFPAGKRAEVEISRRYLGVDGAPARYLLFTIPPRRQ